MPIIYGLIGRLDLRLNGFLRNLHINLKCIFIGDFYGNIYNFFFITYFIFKNKKYEINLKTFSPNTEEKLRFMTSSLIKSDFLRNKIKNLASF